MAELQYSDETVDVTLETATALSNRDATALLDLIRANPYLISYETGTHPDDEENEGMVFEFTKTARVFSEFHDYDSEVQVKEILDEGSPYQWSMSELSRIYSIRKTLIQLHSDYTITSFTNTV